VRFVLFSDRLLSDFRAALNDEARA